MKNKWPDRLSIILLLSMFIIGAHYYPFLPATLASHWDAQGNVNGYMSKFWGLFFMPILATGLYVLLKIVPSIDPKKANIAKFRSYYDWFIVVFLFFFLCIYGTTIAWNLGHRFDMLQVMIPAFAILFYFIGAMMEKAEPNWFIGIRTPWTLSSETVWKKTHALGAKLFKISAVISLLGLLGGHFVFVFLIGPILLASIYLMIYSYLEYRKL